MKKALIHYTKNEKFDDSSPLCEVFRTEVVL